MELVSNESRQPFLCENASRDESTSAFQLLDSWQPLNLALSICFLLYVAVGLPWNILVSATILKLKLHSQPSILLLLNLVITDCLLLLFELPVRVISGLSQSYVFGSTDHIKCEFCRVHLIFGKNLYISSLFALSLIALDRFLYIHKPLHYDKLVTTKRTVVVIAAIWLLSTLLSLFHLVILRDVSFSYLEMECQWVITEHRYFHILSALAIILPYFVFLVCNVWVVVIVLRNISAVYRVQAGLSSRRSSVEAMRKKMSEKRHRKQLHLLRVFGAIICYNSLSSLPLAVLAVFSLVNPHVIPDVFVIVADLLFVSQVVMHPILETTLVADIRKPLKMFCVSRWKRVLPLLVINRSSSDDKGMFFFRPHSPILKSKSPTSPGAVKESSSESTSLRLANGDSKSSRLSSVDRANLDGAADQVPGDKIRSNTPDKSISHTIERYKNDTPIGETTRHMPGLCKDNTPIGETTGHIPGLCKDTTPPCETTRHMCKDSAPLGETTRHIPEVNKDSTPNRETARHIPGICTNCTPIGESTRCSTQGVQGQCP